VVIWITGLSGAGKTTLSHAVRDLVKPRLPELVLVDGDAVRELFGQDLDYSEPSRVIQITRLRKLARFVADQGQVVIVAALYCHPDLLAENRRQLPGYVEVYLRTPFELLQTRDQKGLYSGALAGRVANVVGVDIPWHAPASPDFELDGGIGLPPALLAAELARRIPRLKAALPEELQ
jgi:adenylylsulfate kinase-like enzyme